MELGRLYLLGFNLVCVSALTFAGVGFVFRLVVQKMPQEQIESGQRLRTTSKPPAALRPD